MPRPWAFLLAVIVTAITAAERIRVLLGGMPAKKHIAALPFAAIGSGEERQVFADGLTETVTSKLSELEQFQNALWVVPSSEVRARKLASVEGTRKAFGVTLVVTGTVRRDPNAITVATNLVVTRSLKQLRSRVVEVPVRSAAALEPRIVGSLSEMLGLILQPEARRLVSAGQTGNPDAYQSYQDALGYLRRFGSKMSPARSGFFVMRSRKIRSMRWHLPRLGEAYWRTHVQ